MKRIVFLPLLIIFISGCTSTSQPSTVKIENAQYEDGSLLLTLYTNQSVSNVGINIIGENGQNLCTKSKNLSVGTNHFEFTDCGLENQIKVSVSPPGGTTSTKDFNLGLPVLNLQKGFRYDYLLIACADCPPQDVSIYATEETQDNWEGIAGIKNSYQRAYLLRYKISKSDMSLLSTETLNATQIVQTNLDYKNIKDLSTDALYALYPFFLSVIKEQGLNLDELIQSKSTIFSQQSLKMKIEGAEVKDSFLGYKIIAAHLQSEEVAATIHVSTAKPYLLIRIEVDDGSMSFKGSERKDFSIDDYSGYTLEEIHRAVQEPIRRE